MLMRKEVKRRGCYAGNKRNHLAVEFDDGVFRRRRVDEVGGAYDDQAGGFRNDISSCPDGRRVRGGDLDVGPPMKQAKNEDGQVIDFHAVRSALRSIGGLVRQDMRTRTEVNMKRLLSFVFADVTIPHRVMLAAWLTWAVSYWFVGEAVLAAPLCFWRLASSLLRGFGRAENDGRGTMTSILAK